MTPFSISMFEILYYVIKNCVNLSVIDLEMHHRFAAFTLLSIFILFPLLKSHITV